MKWTIALLIVLLVVMMICSIGTIGVTYNRHWIGQKVRAIGEFAVRLGQAAFDAPAEPTPAPIAAGQEPAEPAAILNPIVILAPVGNTQADLPGVTGEELNELFDSYPGGIIIVHTWTKFAASTKANSDSRQPDHGHLWSGTCEGSIFHRGGVNQNLQNRGADFWLQECSTGDPSALWAVWVPWAP